MFERGIQADATSTAREAEDHLERTPVASPAGVGDVLGQPDVELQAQRRCDLVLEELARLRMRGSMRASSSPS
jgi:hypothetical protein